MRSQSFESLKSVDIIKEKPVDKKDAVDKKTAVKLLKKLNLREVRLFSEKIFVFLHEEITKNEIWTTKSKTRKR